MYKKLVMVCLLVLMALCLQAKRVEPAVVEPLLYNGVKYIADEPLKGYVTAVRQKTNEYLWVTQAYKVMYNYDLEIDVQDVFIKKLTIKKDYLYIENESSQVYAVNLNTGKLKGTKGVIDLRKNGVTRKVDLKGYEAIRIAWERYVEFTAPESPGSYQMAEYKFEKKFKDGKWFVYLCLKDENTLGGDAEFYIDGKSGKIESEEFGE